MWQEAYSPALRAEVRARPRVGGRSDFLTWKTSHGLVIKGDTTSADLPGDTHSRNCHAVRKEPTGRAEEERLTRRAAEAPGLEPASASRHADEDPSDPSASSCS